VSFFYWLGVRMMCWVRVHARISLNKYMKTHEFVIFIGKHDNTSFHAKLMTMVGDDDDLFGI